MAKRVSDFQLGSKLQALDKETGIWTVATVKDLDMISQKVLVSFDGWDDEWNQWRPVKHVRCTVPTRKVSRCPPLGLPVSSSKLLSRDDEVFFRSGPAVIRALVLVNDPFMGCVTIKTGRVCKYEHLLKESVSSIATSESMPMESDSAILTDSDADPEWAAPRPKRQRTQVTQVSRKKPQQTANTARPKATKKKQTVISIIGEALPSIQTHRPRLRERAERELHANQGSCTQDILYEESPEEFDTDTVSISSGSPFSTTKDVNEQVPSIQDRISSLEDTVKDIRGDVRQMQQDLHSAKTSLVNQIHIFQVEVLQAIAAISHIQPQRDDTPVSTTKTTITDQRIWMLTPAELPACISDESIDYTISNRTDSDPVALAKEKGAGSRHTLAKHLMANMFNLKETHGRNVNGRANNIQQAKMRLEPGKVAHIFDVCFKLFPSSNVDGDKAKCVDSMNSYLRYLWSVRLARVVLPPCPE